MNDYSWSSSQSKPSTPQTLQDYICLLTALKEKYGNINVKVCATESVESNSMWQDNFDDIRVFTQESKSLLNDNNSNNVSPTLLFVVD